MTEKSEAAVFVQLAEAFPSPTNPRGDFKTTDPEFRDLVASIEERGILVPLIGRKVKGKVEIIAGNRRFAAAKHLKLESVPVKIMDLDDAGAQEVQIIENLQRQDIHPLDEGEAFRALFEGPNNSVAGIALKVGKSEDYVRGRMFLTNLQGSARSAFRKNELPITHALLIAPLLPSQQSEIIKWMADEWETPSVKDLKQEIEERFTDPLKNQPWLKNAELAKAIGPCTDCPKNKSTLFGAAAGDECVDVKCWRKKMDRMIAYLFEQLEAEQAKAEKPKPVVKISESYTREKGILGSGQYTAVSKKERKQCESAALGLIVEGAKIGQVIDVCFDPACKTHSKQISTPYKLTPEERAKRKKEREADKKKQEKADAKVLELVSKATWPIKPGTFDIIFNLAIDRAHQDSITSVCKRHGWEPAKRQGYSYNSDKKAPMINDWEATLKREVKSMSRADRLQLMLEVMSETSWEDERGKALKGLA